MPPGGNRKGGKKGRPMGIITLSDVLGYVFDPVNIQESVEPEEPPNGRPTARSTLAATETGDRGIIEAVNWSRIRINKDCINCILVVELYYAAFDFQSGIGNFTSVHGCDPRLRARPRRSVLNPNPTTYFASLSKPRVHVHSWQMLRSVATNSPTIHLAHQVNTHVNAGARSSCL
jgi:hypothetical protein